MTAHQSPQSLIPNPPQNSPNVGVNGHRLTALDIDVEGDRLRTVRADFDLVRTGRQVQVPHRAVEVLDDADVVAVGKDLRVSRRSLDTDAAIRDSRLRAHVVLRRRRAVAGRTVTGGRVRIATVGIWVGVGAVVRIRIAVAAVVRVSIPKAGIEADCDTRTVRIVVRTIRVGAAEARMDIARMAVVAVPAAVVPRERDCAARPGDHGTPRSGNDAATRPGDRATARSATATTVAGGASAAAATTVALC